MKNSFLLLGIIFLLSSCQFFETEKIPSETFYAEELETIDWHEVDRYPLFKDCEESSEKEIQKRCFEAILTTKMYQSISDQSLIASQKIIDTLYLTMLVSQEGALSITELKIDSVTRRDFPKLEAMILSAVDSMQLVAPAYKRGIPVRTQFTLPVVLQSE
ncbi:hypothetical protein ACFQO1_02140 [Jejudonia soesokkakensis]|uniref:TonB C-terminal domain-containing protein n=1 Tax=Jejudonia soesokkakensis TaxID=1323432 RepID=A0ABW2MNJ8_9FLAO